MDLNPHPHPGPAAAVPSGAADGQRGALLDRLLLLALAGVAGAVLLATPALITPFPAKVAWFESPALFPRAALALAVAGALAELWVRRHGLQRGESDELDSSAMNLPRAAVMLLLFVAYALAVPVLGFMASTAAYLLACGATLRLPWRQTLALALPLAVVLWVVFVVVLKVAFGHGWLP